MKVKREVALIELENAYFRFEVIELEYAYFRVEVN